MEMCLKQSTFPGDEFLNEPSVAKKIFRNEMKLRDGLLGNCGTHIILTPPDKTLLEIKVTGQ